MTAEAWLIAAGTLSVLVAAAWVLWEPICAGFAEMVEVLFG